MCGCYIVKIYICCIRIGYILVLLKSVKITHMMLLLAKEKWERRKLHILLPLYITSLIIEMIAQRSIDSFSLSFFLINVCYTSKHAFFNSIQWFYFMQQKSFYSPISQLKIPIQKVRQFDITSKVNLCDPIGKCMLFHGI